MPPVPKFSLDQTMCVAESAGECRRAGRSPAWGSSPLTVTQAVFERFQRLIYGESGIWLANSKKALLCGRLAKRLRAVHAPTLADYHDLVTQPDQHVERLLMIDAITTNETHFFREPKHFEFLLQEIVPRWRLQAGQQLRSRTIRI